MLQMVTECHFKWRLIHSTFIIYVIAIQFSKINGEKLIKSNCPDEGIFVTSAIDCNLKKEIVAAHNELRQKIAQGLVLNQPSAVNMQEMYWDDELARKAQQWSHYCTFGHSDPNDRADARFNEVGENLGQTKSKIKSEKKDFNKHIQKWFNENEKFTYGPVIEKNLPITGHYTQLASANTYLVGCGFSRFRIKNIYYRLYICQYGPSGNNFGHPPYEAGDVNCNGDLEPSKTYPNLCTRKNSPPQINCLISTTPISIESTVSTIIPEQPAGGRKFMDVSSKKDNIISSKYEQYKQIMDTIRDDKIVNNIQIEKMFNLILLNH